MKKISFLLLAIIVLNFASVFAQTDDEIIHDPEAKKILDELSKNFKEYETIRMFFQYTAENKADTSKNDVYNGYLFTKGKDKYKLIIPNIETFSDGKKVWQYNKQVAEINVTYTDPENKALVTPYVFLSLYEEGFKYMLKGEAEFGIKRRKDGKIVEQNEKMYMIDLYPEDINNSPYSIVRLWVSQDKKQIFAAKYFGKEGIDYVLDILEFVPNATINDQIFIFQRDKYPKDVEVIDFTEK